MQITNTAEKTDEPGTVTFLSPALYSKLKNTVLVGLPVIGSLYFGLGQIWGFPNVEEVVGTTTVITTVLGGAVAVSKKRYDESDAPHSGEIIVTRDDGGVKGWMLALDGDPEELGEKKSVSFKIVDNPVYDPTP